MPMDSKEIVVIKKSKDIDNVSKHVGNAEIKKVFILKINL